MVKPKAFFFFSKKQRKTLRVMLRSITILVIKDLIFLIHFPRLFINCEDDDEDL